MTNGLGKYIRTPNHSSKEKTRSLGKSLIMTSMVLGGLAYGVLNPSTNTKTSKYQGWEPSSSGKEKILVFDKNEKENREGKTPFATYEVPRSFDASQMNLKEVYTVKDEKYFGVFNVYTLKKGFPKGKNLENHFTDLK